MAKKTNEILITNDNYKQKLLELEELRERKIAFKNSKVANNADSVARLMDMLDERSNMSDRYDGRQTEINKVSKQIELYRTAFDKYIKTIEQNISREEKEKANIQKSIDEEIASIERSRKRIRDYREDIKTIDAEVRKNKSLEKEIQKGLTQQHISNKSNYLIMDDVKVGDTIKLGSYPQDKTGSKKSPIEWIVLDVQEGKALLISKYALVCRPYNFIKVRTRWADSSLREWLNEIFINDAFNKKEQKLIQQTFVAADDNPRYDTSPGPNTTDRVFLLSINDVNKYFLSREARQCKPTDYAVVHGAYMDGSGNCWWWLRSPGSKSKRAAYVYDDINNSGDSVNSSLNAVRPALWVNLEF